MFIETDQKKEKTKEKRKRKMPVEGSENKRFPKEQGIIIFKGPFNFRILKLLIKTNKYTFFVCF